MSYSYILYFLKHKIEHIKQTTVILVYSELGYREYPLIVNGFVCTNCQFIVKLNTFIVNIRF